MCTKTFSIYSYQQSEPCIFTSINEQQMILKANYYNINIWSSVNTKRGQTSSCIVKQKCSEYIGIKPPVCSLQLLTNIFVFKLRYSHQVNNSNTHFDFIQSSSIIYLENSTKKRINNGTCAPCFFFYTVSQIRKTNMNGMLSETKTHAFVSSVPCV